VITQQDIDAFAEQNEADIQAAINYVRLSKKDIPSDRWARGVEGDKAVARGIEAMFQMVEVTSSAFLTIWHEKMQADKDSMSLGPPKQRQ